MKLNLGCGTNKLQGWVNHDADVDITKPLPFGNSTASYIFIEHCVEHVNYQKAIAFFHEAYRVLKPGGRLRVTVPSIEQIARSNNQKYFSWVHKNGWSPSPDRRGAMHAIIYAHGHQMAWTSTLMQATLDFVGFEKTAAFAPGQSDTDSLRGVEGHGKVIGDEFNNLESICFEGSKPGDLVEATQDLNKDYDANFYHMHIKWKHEYEHMANLLMNTLEFNSVVDFGCGNGYLLQHMGKHGKSNLGVDGSENVLKYFPDAVIRDLTKPLNVGKFDLVVCTEVAEHIAPEHADTLVETICNASDGLIFFSAAKAGYGGHLHVNEQERPYWYEKFMRRGFSVDLELSQDICDHLREANKGTWWFANNCFVLRRTKPAIAIVVGGALCWEEDLQKALNFCSQYHMVPEFYAVNDHIASFPYDVVACTLHPDKLNGWLGTRSNNGHPYPKTIWSHEGSRPLGNNLNVQRLKDWGGSTGMFAYQVARSYGHKVIFCGVPMNNEPNYFRKQRWTAVTAFTRAWQARHPEMKPYARSMSGWTAELLGQPDEEWLRCSQESQT
jgi:predicted SAM-dependent methyltransferase